MTESPESSQKPEADDVYREFVERRRRGENVDLDEYLRQYPRLENALRALHSIEGEVGDGDDKATLRVPSETASAGAFGGALAAFPAREGLADLVPLAPGARVGAYRIEEVIGEGGFAFVYRARQLEPVARTVALKTLKLGVDTKEVIARFDAERQTLAMMQHSHIAKVFDAGVTDDGRPFFVLELVDGEPLSEHCDRLGLSLDERLALFLRVCDAVQHAHQKAIIHRDLKPSNVLVTLENGHSVPKIIDFGIAKATAADDLAAETGFTRAGQVIGTPEYMSPEQASGGVVDTRTDLYALGCILYELLAGVRPFDWQTLRVAGLSGMLDAIREKVPARPSTRVRLSGDAAQELARQRGASPTLLARSLRGDLDWITMKALAKDPDARYASVSELAADLRRHLACLPVLAGPPSVSYRLRKLARRHRRALVALSAMLVCVVVVGFVVLRVVEERHIQDRVGRGGELVGRGRELAGAARATLAQLLAKEKSYDRTRRQLADWVPIWERKEELEAWRELEALKRRLEDSYSQAFLQYTNALNEAPARSAPWRDAVYALDSMYDEIQARGEISLGTVLLKQQLEVPLASEGVGAAAAIGEARSIVRLRSSPAGARVSCYRYEAMEERLLPRPFDPRAGRTVGQLLLRVDRVFDESKIVLRATSQVSGASKDRLRPGDRFIAVQGQTIATRGDLARALASVQLDQSIVLKLRRDEEILELSWTPFRKEDYDAGALADHLEPGRLVSIRDQLGFTFEGYPLERHAACRIGTTGEATLELELPRGSYLFVFEKPGYVETRFPLYLRGEPELVEDVRLLESDRLPEDFVYIPEGPAILGGSDPEYLQTLRYDEQPSGGFAIGRFEVTFAEYLEFLDARAKEEGRAEPATVEVREELVKLARARGHSEVPTEIELRPQNAPGGDYLVTWQEGRWVAKSPRYRPWPVLGISYFAAVEYAHWRSSSKGQGRTYRLPTDEEWERAARGADGRTYVWGDYMVWSYSFNKNGNHRAPPKRPPEFTGISPLDESVFGVRDLEGSVDEPTSGRTKTRRRYIVRRGGAWEAEDAYEFRLDTRVGFPPEARSRRMGIRLVCELGE